jgi:2-C-methyl-D-erythritol 4-phosphate cytidylyltransferase
MKKYALIVAGGSGSRMNSDIPKQFIQIHGKPIIIHTIEAFIHSGEAFEIIVSINSNYLEEWESMRKNFLPDHLIITACGGPTRFHSVKNGLACISDDNSIVAIHDAVRPLVNSEVIRQAVKTAISYGNAIPVVPINDSVRKKEGIFSEVVDRNTLVAVQTPQCFQTSLIKDAYNQNYDERFLDDAVVLEKTGKTIRLIEGNPENIKITRPIDLLIAKSLLS